MSIETDSPDELYEHVKQLEKLHKKFTVKSSSDILDLILISFAISFEESLYRNATTAKSSLNNVIYCSFSSTLINIYPLKDPVLLNPKSVLTL